MPSVPEILDELESFHGPQAAGWPTDPYEFIVWWNCGYPPSEERCTQGWQSLAREIGTSVAEVIAAKPTSLARALRASGMLPDVRAGRLKEIARRTRAEFGGDLRAALILLPAAGRRKALKSFPGIAGPGADRILLFAGLEPVTAVPSNCVHVPVRILSGTVSEQYAANYRKAQSLLTAQLPASPPALRRAYLLLQRHGRQLCKLTNPKCSECPLERSCAYATGARRRRP